VWACGCGGCARVVDICLNVQSPFRMHRCVHHAHAGVCACMRGHFLWLRPVRPRVRPSLRGGRGPQVHAVRGRSIFSTKVTALPEWLGQCKLLEELCVPRPPPPPPCAFAALPALRVALGRAGAPGRAALRCMRRRRCCRSSVAAEPRARMAGARGRPARDKGGPEPPGAAARWARRSASSTELAALPAAVEWPNLKIL
jgi:hypothetical protein